MTSEPQMCESKIGSVVVRPLDDRVIVRPENPPDKTPGGVIMPDSATEEPAKGLVMAVGPGRLLRDGPMAGRFFPVGVEKGQTVIFSRYSGVDIEIDGIPMKVIRADDVIASLDEVNGSE